MTDRTANEQRIASLEAEVVTMREAMSGLITGLMLDHPTLAITLNDWPPIITARSVLSSTDYANKVVVDREDFNLLESFLRNTIHQCGSFRYSELLARLDSLRKEGGQG